eukprot:9285526-Prorocentrum_lima.AAC.1
MTALMEDVRSDLRSRNIPTQAGHLPGVHESEFLYADDTLCVSSDATLLQETLHSIETTSAMYGLRLNQIKCEHLSFNQIRGITFSDGTPVKHASEVKYLGCYLNDRVDPKVEIRRRI